MNLVATITFEFDNMRTPYDGSVLKPLMIKTDNNEVKETITFPGADVIYESIISYEYNAHGYPIKSVANADGFYRDQAETVVYEYDCK